MKTLYIARHAKSDWGQAGYTDFDRPLNDRGFIDAKAMARHLMLISVKVDAIISSSAMRAITTAKFYADQISAEGDLITKDEIYQADEQDMLEIINDVSNDIDSLMLVGHNPTFSLLVELLTGKAVGMSAGSVIELSIDVNAWGDVGKGDGDFIKMTSPKDLRF
jgi:phosphohistidine phosphatase